MRNVSKAFGDLQLAGGKQVLFYFRDWILWE